MRHVVVFTSSRSDWGALEGLVHAMSTHVSLRVTVLATGSHFDASFGRTIDSILRNYADITFCLDLGLVGDSSREAGEMAGKTVSSVSNWLEANAPECVIILGDRFEALSCALAAVINLVPIVHLHGGEITTGAIDDSVRHAISKLSQLHFPVHEDYRRRLIRMGEDPDRIFVTGSLALEALRGNPLLSRLELEAVIGSKIPETYFVCAVHPVTTNVGETTAILGTLESLLVGELDIPVFLSAPAPDPGSRKIREAFLRWSTAFPSRFFYRESLGLQVFLSLVSKSAGLIGNSSSGILEVPGLGVPTVNIGSRQDGRVRAASVIDAEPEIGSLRGALENIWQPAFKQTVLSTVNPFEGASPTKSIIKRIVESDFRSMRRKPFYEERGGQ